MLGLNKQDERTEDGKKLKEQAPGLVRVIKDESSLLQRSLYFDRFILYFHYRCITDGLDVSGWRHWKPVLGQKGRAAATMATIKG